MGKHACIFTGTAIRPVDDRIQAAWKARFGIGAPFGSLRQEWRRQHCRTINPYGSDSCPFTMEQCRAAFENAVMDSFGPQVIDARVYFISVAKTTGMQRAENKPQAPQRISSTIAGPGVIGAAWDGSQARRGADLADGTDGRSASPLVTGIEAAVHPRRARPTRVGDMLRPPAGGPRQGPADDGETRSER